MEIQLLEEISGLVSLTIEAIYVLDGGKVNWGSIVGACAVGAIVAVPTLNPVDIGAGCIVGGLIDG